MTNFQRFPTVHTTTRQIVGYRSRCRLRCGYRCTSRWVGAASSTGCSMASSASPQQAPQRYRGGGGAIRPSDGVAFGSCTGPGGAAAGAGAIDSVASATLTSAAGVPIVVGADVCNRPVARRQLPEYGVGHGEVWPAMRRREICSSWMTPLVWTGAAWGVAASGGAGFWFRGRVFCDRGGSRDNGFGFNCGRWRRWGVGVSTAVAAIRACDVYYRYQLLRALSSSTTLGRTSKGRQPRSRHIKDGRIVVLVDVMVWRFVPARCWMAPKKHGNIQVRGH